MATQQTELGTGEGLSCNDIIAIDVSRTSRLGRVGEDRQDATPGEVIQDSRNSGSSHECGGLERLGVLLFTNKCNDPEYLYEVTLAITPGKSEAVLEQLLTAIEGVGENAIVKTGER